MAIDKELLKQVNKLAKLQKERELTSEEKELQANYRKLYLEQFKGQFKAQLDNIDKAMQVVVDLKEEEVKELLSSNQDIISINSCGNNKTNIVYKCDNINLDDIYQILNIKN
ncbi:MAG: DUF896 domain-containing protein [Mycoplasmatales bacterium]